MKKIFLLICFAFLLSCSSDIIQENDWTKDNLNGEVKSITETKHVALNYYDTEKKGKIIWYTKYDDKGNKLEESYNSNHLGTNFPGKNLYTYNNKNELLEQHQYKNNGKLLIKALYELNKKGKHLEASWNYPDGSSFGKTTYKYNHHGKLTEEIWYLSDGSLDEKIRYKYDISGNRIENKAYRSDGSLLYKFTYEYNERGNKIEEDIYNSDGEWEESIIYEYELDKRGNWTKKLAIKNEEPISITERQYQYY